MFLVQKTLSMGSWRRFTVALITALLLGITPATAQQPKALLLGVIGLDSPTERGVQLAVERFNARGNTVTPDGTAYQLAVKAEDANTADEVNTAIQDLKNAGAVAIFGPERDDLAPASANAMLGAGIPIFTSATSPSVATGSMLFRTRADDNRQLTGLAQFIAGDLAKSHIALFQGDQSVAQQVTLFTTALGQLGKTPATTVLQVSGGAIKDSAHVLLQSQPDAIVDFGAADQAVQLLRELRGQGYTGSFSYPNAEDQAFMNAVPDDLRGGIIGVSNWVYSSATTVSAQFVRDYVALFGTTPMPESAAAYDAAAATIIAIARNGTKPDAIAHGILALPRVESIQGHFNAALGNNELSADVAVFTTGPYGAPIASAQFDETGRLALNTSSAPVSGGPTATLVPTAVPQATTQPTAPVGVVLTVTTDFVNVRGGPGTNYAILGQIKQGTTEQAIGVSPDGQWLVITFAQQEAWVTTNPSLVTVTGNVQSLPIINPPATPVPPTSTPSPYVDLVGVTYVFNPPQPKSGQPFTVSVVIRNQGQVDAGQFAVAASFLPGNVYAASVVQSLPAGQTTTINLTATVTGPGTYTVAVVLDLNKQLNLGPNRAHSNFPVTYTVVS